MRFAKVAILQPELRRRECSSRTSFCTGSSLRTTFRSALCVLLFDLEMRFYSGAPGVHFTYSFEQKHNFTAAATEMRFPYYFLYRRCKCRAEAAGACFALCTARHSHGPTARGLRHARSPHRVRRAQDTFARRYSESASTHTMSAEGSPRSRHMRTAPQRESRSSRFVCTAPSESASTRTISAESWPSSRHICAAQPLASAHDILSTSRKTHAVSQKAALAMESSRHTRIEDRHGATARAQF